MPSDKKSLHLQNLPTPVLEVLIEMLGFEGSLVLRNISKSFREVVSRKFVLGYKTLLPRITKKLSAIEGKLPDLASSLCSREDGRHFVNHIIRYSVLRIMYTDVRLIRALCHRYIDAGVWNFISLYSGSLLDNFYNLLTITDLKSVENTIDSNVTSELFNVSDEFLRHFIDNVENSLSFEVPFEFKIVDVMDCAAEASVVSRYIQWDEMCSFCLKANYSILDLTSVEFPWEIMEEGLDIKEKLKSIVKCIKNNVRYSNYCVPLKEVWQIEELYETRNVTHLQEYLTMRRHYHREEDLDTPCSQSHQPLPWFKDGEFDYRDRILTRSLSPFRESMFMEVEMNLEGGGTGPLDVPRDAPQDTATECNRMQPINCDLHLYMQYSSLCGLRIKCSCVRVLAKHGIYKIEIHDHD